MSRHCTEGGKPGALVGILLLREEKLNTESLQLRPDLYMKSELNQLVLTEGELAIGAGSLCLSRTAAVFPPSDPSYR